MSERQRKKFLSFGVKSNTVSSPIYNKQNYYAYSLKEYTYMYILKDRKRYELFIRNANFSY